MRIVLAVAAAMLALAAGGCGGPSKTASPTLPAATWTPAAATSPAADATSAAPVSSSPSGVIVEVTGIIGTVSTATGLIEIDRLSGAPVRRISVTTATILRRAGGGTTTLGLLRPSQRIIARGTMNDRGDTLLASQITVQDVVPGVQPGG